MAEWSKALRLGRSTFGCVGSNPTPVILFLHFHKRQISTGNAQKNVKVKSITEHTQMKTIKEAGWPSGLRRCV